MAQNDFRYTIEDQLGVISRNDTTGWTKELNRITWGNVTKLDIRSWDNDRHEHMSRGITLTDEEGLRLMQLLRMYFDRIGRRI